MDRLLALRQKLNTHFLSWGWLLPAPLMVFEIIGRAPLNIVLSLYLVWALFFLSEHGLGRNALHIYLFFAVVAAFGLSLFGAGHALRGAQGLMKYSLMLLTFFVTCQVLEQNAENWKRMFKTLAITGLASMLVMIVRELISSGGQNIIPAHTLLEKNLSYLLPFLLFHARNIQHKSWRWAVILSAAGLFFVFIIFSAGRSALVALVAALFVYGLLGLKLRLRSLAVISVVLVLLAGVLGGALITRQGYKHDVAYDNTLDRLSSGRTVLWRQAVQNPPDNIWLGVGMRNVRYSEEVVSIKGKKVKHLHNFIFDCWYETGFLGLAAYLAFLGSILAGAVRRWRTHLENNRQLLAVVFASVTAILVGGSFSFSYYSPQMSIFLFFILAATTCHGRSEIETRDMEPTP